MLVEQGLRHACAIRSEVFADAFVFGAPAFHVDVQQRLKFGLRQAETVEIQVLRAREIADRGFLGALTAGTAAQDPFQYAHIVAKTRPQELAVLAFAEPVDVKDLRQLRAGLVQAQPVPEIIGEVVAAERLHRHRIAAQHAHRAGRGGGGFRAHRRADQYAVGPVARLEHERNQMLAAAAENDRGNRHAFGILGVRRPARTLLGRYREARIRMRGRTVRRQVVAALPVLDWYAVWQALPPRITVGRNGDVGEDRVVVE